MSGPSSATVSSAYDSSVPDLWQAIAVVTVTPGWGMHPGVGQQIADELVQAVGVPAHPDRLVGQVLDPAMSGRGHRRVVHRIEDEVAQVNVFAAQILTLAEAREQQQLIDE